MLRTDSQRARSTGELSSEPSNHAMHHSHSTPAGVDGGIRTPPPTPKKAGKMLAVKVVPLHDNSTIFQIQAKALGRVLFDQVCKQLNLLEADYFGLEYKDLSGTRYWLDLQKPLSRQVGLSLVEPELYFCVKFYTPDPGQLEEEFTRYLFCLQVKRDLAEGHLHCNDNTAALLASYLVQAECGDYASEDYPDHTYLSSYKFVPHQDHELECRIMENHKKHIGQSPAEADLNLLETARRCELYGMKMHPAKDHEGAALNLAVAHMGIVVFQHYSKINTFSWAKIRKISFKRKRFLIKLHPEGHGYYKDLVEFLFEGRDECKNFWKKCVEHHGFFRCSAVKNVSRHKTRVLSRGSSFRYSGKTQKQIVEFVRDNYVKRETHHRSASFRRSAPSSKANVHTKVVGNSISAHPLLPLADPSLAEEVASPRQGASEEDWGEGSQTTRVAFLRPDTATRSKESVSREATTSSPSPPRTTQSAQCADEHAETSADEGTYPIAANRMVHSQSVSYEAIVYSPPPASDKEQDSLNTSVLSQTDSISNNQTFETSAQNDSMCISKSSMDELLKNNVNGVCLEESKKKRFMGNRSYFIMKEMLMTERTYRKDLDVIGVLWKEEVAEESGELGELLLSLIKPLTSVHASFLLALELCLQILENRAPITDTSQCTVASVLSNFIPSLMPLYEDYLNGHVTVLEQLNVALQRSSRFEQLHHEFEIQKIKHLPFTCFVMKPLYRILHYKNLLDRLLDFYDVNDDDRASCVEARAALTPLLPPLIDTLSYSENLIMLSELQRDVIGFNFSGHVRQFLRLGCLMSYTKKGCQKRMFFLFSDVLLYASKVSNSSCFRACGYMNLKGVMIDEPEKAITKYSFIIYGGNRAITVAANSQEDKDIWLEDLRIAIQHAREQTDSSIPYVDLKSSSSEEAVDQGTLSERTAPRIDTLIQACWHRNKTVGFQDILNSIENHLSGYLLRKFKNSNGWQRLWVVLYSFCLFFYKSSTDEFPLASLPLLGYSIGHPSAVDNISKEFVFKLQFKNHVYFFRTDSEYAFERWMEVIKNTTNNSNIKIGE